ncbi:WG repeat-containing protein [Massilia scottii]|uniref:WG repeat-containing protein n=1 Tax=Massilia scottii TaxID=3057166 RepID=UPI00279692E6|nr:WG repeat-containing protein [Massilia sp. CCM 9029]MDQ1831101.1 WG repeat-containing protein [Massilia sp. CCM 9029]
MKAAGELPDLLVLHHGQVRQPAPALLQVSGSFCADGNGGAIAAAVAVDGRHGYLDASGDWVVEPTLKDARSFGSDGLARFCEQGLWGYRNLKGDVVIAAQYEKAEAFNFGLAAVMIGERRWRYIDTSGRFAFDGFLRHAGPFTAVGLAVARGSTYKCGYIDRTGAWAIAPRFERPAPFSPLGVAPATENGELYGLINRQGEWVQQPCYSQIDAFNDDGLAYFRVDWNHEGYLDAAGIPVISNMSHLSRTMRSGVVVETSRSYLTASGPLVFDVALDWCDDFNTHGFALARAVDAAHGPVWGIARPDASFAIAPADMLEPLTDKDHNLAAPLAGTPLLAFLARDGSIAMLDRDARVAYRLRAHTGPEGSYAALYDDADRQLWQGPPCAALLLPQPYFCASPDALLAELRTVDELVAYAESMVAATEAKLRNIGALPAVENGESEPDDAYAYNTGNDDVFNHDDDLDASGRLAKSLRTRRRIFRSYLDEGENMSFEFLNDERHAMMTAVHARCVARLTAHFGPPAPDPDFAGAAPAPDTQAWRVGQLWLGIWADSEYGDGDSWQHIWLVCTPSRQALDTALANHRAP